MHFSINLNTIMPYTMRNKQKKKNVVVSHWSRLILYYVEYNILMLEINKNLWLLNDLKNHHPMLQNILLMYIMHYTE